MLLLLLLEITLGFSCSTLALNGLLSTLFVISAGLLLLFLIQELSIGAGLLLPITLLVAAFVLTSSFLFLIHELSFVLLYPPIAIINQLYKYNLTIISAAERRCSDIGSLLFKYWLEIVNWGSCRLLAHSTVSANFVIATCGIIICWGNSGCCSNFTLWSDSVITACICWDCGLLLSRSRYRFL